MKNSKLFSNNPLIQNGFSYGNGQIYPPVRMIFVFMIFTFVFLGCHGCDCKEEDYNLPDLTSKVLALAAVGEIQKDEPTDFECIVENVKSSSESYCPTLEALASIAGILIDYFIYPEDPESENVLNLDLIIPVLKAGEQANNSVNYTFSNEGVYLLNVTADKTDVVKERNEDNNIANIAAEPRSLSLDLFSNASEEFKAKLAKSSVIIIVGDLGYNKNISSYNGKPIYYIK